MFITHKLTHMQDTLKYQVHFAKFVRERVCNSIHDLPFSLTDPGYNMTDNGDTKKSHH